MQVIQSNRLEWLGAQLAERLLEGGPFAQRWVVVPTKALKEWIQLKMAQEVGVCTGVQFLFLEELLDRNMGREEIALRIELEGVETRLAHRLAGHFRDYAIYGQKMIEKWEGWQADLWKKVGYKWKMRELPEQMHLFAFAHLPKSLMEGLKDASIYVLTPCAHFWADIEKEEQRLLAQFGKLGRQLQWQVGEPHSVHYESGAGTHLAAIQNEMLNLEKQEWVEDDSVQIHAAPSRWREVQVLRDQLQGVEPGEVVVMAPNIADYLPFIRAEFDGVPYRVEDGVESHREFWLLVDLMEGRWEASQVLPLLEFEEEEMAQVRRWIKEVGIFWGRDREHRKKLRGDVQGSWSEGIDQLIAALATRLPISEGDLLEKLMERLEELKIELPESQTLLDWSKWLAELPVEAPPLQVRLPGESFAWKSVRYLLEQAPERRKTIGAAQLNAITFCSLLPMRAVPAKIVALLGMDEGSFPRPAAPRAYDELLNCEDADWRPTQTDYDRYLFLEALLSAREKLIATYSCVNEEDGLPQGPALPLQELQVEPKTHPALELVEAPEPLPAVIASSVSPKFFEVHELVGIASDPLRHYCRRVLGIRIEEEEPVLDDAPLSLSGLELYRLSWEALQGSFDERVLPPGPYGELARSKIEQRAAELKATLLPRITLSEAVSRETEIEEGHFLRPPIEIEGIRIIGQLPLVVERRGDGPTRIRNWPRILIHEEPGEQLRAFVQHAKRCCERPCPWTASEVAHLLTGRPAKPEPSPYNRYLPTERDSWCDSLEKAYSAVFAENNPLKSAELSL